MLLDIIYSLHFGCKQVLCKPFLLCPQFVIYASRRAIFFLFLQFNRIESKYLACLFPSTCAAGKSNHWRAAFKGLCYSFFLPLGSSPAKFTFALT